MQAIDGRLASSSWDQTIRFWDINSFECNYVINANHGSIFSLVLLADGRFDSGVSDSSLEIWEENPDNK